MPHRFDIGGKQYNVEVSYYDAGSPGIYHARPEDCYPDDPWEIEFEAHVDVDDGEKTLPFDQFLVLYAQEHTDGDKDKALEQIEEKTHTEITEGALEYEP